MSEEQGFKKELRPIARRFITEARDIIRQIK